MLIFTYLEQSLRLVNSNRPVEASNICLFEGDSLGRLNSYRLAIVGCYAVTNCCIIVRDVIRHYR